MERKPAAPITAETSTGSDSSDKETATTKKKTFPRMPIQAPITERPHAEQLEQPKMNLFEFAAEQKAEADHETQKETAEVSKLDSEETQFVSEQIASEHLEHSEAETPQTEFLERVQDGTDAETAFTEVATELGMTEEEIAEALAEVPEEGIEDDETETTSESVDDEDEPIDASGTATGASRSTASSGGASSGPGSGLGGGSGTPPPPPPVSPTPPSPSGGPTGPRRSSTPTAGSGSPIPTPVAPSFNTAPRPAAVPAESFANRRNRAGELLFVGVVGYLIGRRRGRIKTEKQLIPVQKKLEKQVTALERNISHKEQQLAAANVRLQEQAKPIRERTEALPKAPTEQRMQPGRKETRLGLEKPARTERLAHMIVAAEAPRAVEKRSAKHPTSIRQAFKAEQVKTMPRTELLAVSEKIVVEGATLRQIYETNLIGENQLRHLVSEHLQGKDIHKTLRREIVEREIDFERDPMMRDRVHDELSRGGGSTGLSNLLAKAGVTEEKTNEQQLRYAQKEAERRAEAERKQHKQRMRTDIAMVTAVVVLAVAVVILAFRG